MQLEHMMAEKNILAALRFPFIVQFYGSLQDERHLYLVLQVRTLAGPTHSLAGVSARALTDSHRAGKACANASGTAIGPEPFTSSRLPIQWESAGYT